MALLASCLLLSVSVSLSSASGRVWTHAHSPDDRPMGPPDKATYVLAHFSGTETGDPEGQIRERVEHWLHAVDRHGIAPDCTGLLGVVVPSASNVFLRSGVDCAEEDAVAFDFTGRLNHEGAPDGAGTVTVKQDGKSSSKSCLRVGRLFDRPVSSVSASFFLGQVEGRAILGFDRNDLEAEVLFERGVAHGPFKAKKEDGTFTVGNFIDGKVAGECWIRTDKQIRFGNCSADFELSDEALTVVYERHPKDADKAYSGKDDSVPVAVGGIVKGSTLVRAHDQALIQLKGNKNCTRSLVSGKFRPGFVFDLETGERNFATHDKNELCPKEEADNKEEAGKILRDYFERVDFDHVLGYAPSDEPLDASNAVKIISEVKHITGNKYEAVLNFFKKVKIEFRYLGKKDSSGLFSGYAVLYISDHKKGGGKSGYSRLSGTFVSGELNGAAALVNTDNDQTFGFTTKEGVVHGLVTAVGLLPLYPYHEDKDRYKKFGPYDFLNNGVGLMASFVNGLPSGRIWRGLINEPTMPGFLHGPAAPNSMGVTADDAAYLYPYYETALQGRFEENFMKAAKYAYVKAVSCKQGYVQAEFEVLDTSSVDFFFDPPTNESVGTMPLDMDPHMAEAVVVGMSALPDSGEGLFAKRDVRRGELLSPYTGFMYNKEQMAYMDNEICPTLRDSANPCDKYAIGTSRGGMILIPTPFNDTEFFRASLAWKTNNNFDPLTHAFFHDMEHPRFGLIPAISALKDIKAGTELWIDYGYGHRPNLPPGHKTNHEWYYEQKEAHLKRIEEDVAAKTAKSKGCTLAEDNPFMLGVNPPGVRNCGENASDNQVPPSVHFEHVEL